MPTGNSCIANLTTHSPYLVRLVYHFIKKHTFIIVLAVLCLSVNDSYAQRKDIQASSKLYLDLHKAAPHLNRQALLLAVTAMQCAAKTNQFPAAQRLAVIDYSMPSTQPRMWIFDLKRRRLTRRVLVAHGKQTGEVLAHRFSNRMGSHQSSLGLFVTENTYSGKHGYSLRLKGIDRGFNDLAEDRAIVIHGARYVSSNWVKRYGRIGRSLGCPAVDMGKIKYVVNDLKGGQLVFSYYPDKRWLQQSAWLNCRQKNALLAQIKSQVKLN